jgi:5-methylcytosine-specific restriction endonuclease McrA
MAAYAYGQEPCPWYGKMRWRRMSKAQLRDHPLCVKCLQRGQVIPATVADHIIPHKGDQHAFWFGKLQSLCVPCHNHHKRFEELRGYTTDIDASGWPTDPRHPANRS